MPRFAAFLFAVLAPAAALAEGLVIDHRCVDDRTIPKESLDRARALDVLFGHQSVGGNVLEGMYSLAERDSERYSFEAPNEPEADWFDENAGVGEFAVGENEDPRSKIEHFARKVDEEGFGARVQVAMMKLCFVDIGDDEGEARSVFESYRATMEKLEAKYPKVRFVWWTVPLEEESKAGRNAFNRLVREHCKAKGKALYDLADIESHDAAGKEARGPALCKAWSEDGGHLNDPGKLRAARAFWWLLARLAGWDGKPAGR